MHKHSGLPPLTGSPVSRREALCFAASWFTASPQGESGSDSSLVLTFATVRDTEGKLIGDLRKEDFLLEEDGRPQAIQYFSPASTLPLTIGLLVDASLSQKLIAPEQRRAALQFLNELFRPDQDVAFVIRFDREIEVVQELTSARGKLDAALDSLEKPRARPRAIHPASSANARPSSGGLLYDAVQAAADAQMKKQKGRKALILLSDGVDTGSRILLSDAVEAAQRADTRIYSLFFVDPQANEGNGANAFGARRNGAARSGLPLLPGGKKTLQLLSRETGGGYFEISEDYSLQEAFKEMSDELRMLYQIGYLPSRPEGAGQEYHKLRITVKQAGLTARTRAGYYAPK